jgi:hypothetical protein
MLPTNAASVHFRAMKMTVSQCVEPTIIFYDIDGPPIYDLYLA